MRKRRHIKGKGVWVWGAITALLVVTVLFSTQAFSVSMSVTAQPLQNAGGDLTYSSDYSAASAVVTRHESSDLTVNVSDQVSSITVQGNKANGGTKVKLDLLDTSATILDTITVALPSAAGTYSTVGNLTLGNIAYNKVAKISAVYTTSPDVAVDAVSSGTQGATSSGWSWSHTTGTGNNRLLVVGISMGEPIGNVSGVTYGGTPLTLIRTDLRTEEISSELWYLVNPASGTNTIQVSIAEDEIISNIYGAVTFNNVDQTSPVSGDTGATSGSKSVTVSSAPGDMVMDTIGVFERAVSAVGAGQTAHWSVLEPSEEMAGGAASTETGASSVTMSWSGSGTFALSATNIKKAP